MEVTSTSLRSLASSERWSLTTNRSAGLQEAVEGGYASVCRVSRCEEVRFDHHVRDGRGQAWESRGASQVAGNGSPGPVEVIPRVSEIALLWLAQGIEEDALETLHREGVCQESPEVCFVQSRNQFPDGSFL